MRCVRRTALVTFLALTACRPAREPASLDVYATAKIASSGDAAGDQRDRVVDVLAQGLRAGGAFTIVDAAAPADLVIRVTVRPVDQRREGSTPYAYADVEAVLVDARAMRTVRRYVVRASSLPARRSSVLADVLPSERARVEEEAAMSPEARALTRAADEISREILAAHRRKCGVE